jgi:hypothetical protein
MILVHKACWESSLTIVYFNRLLGRDELRSSGTRINVICRHFTQKPMFQIIIIELFQIQEPSQLKPKTY